MPLLKQLEEREREIRRMKIEHDALVYQLRTEINKAQVHAAELEDKNSELTAALAVAMEELSRANSLY